MKEVCFSFRGKSYKGLIAWSTEEYPHFYWCFIDDPSLVKGLGDCISFQKEREGPLRPSEFYPKEYGELVETVKVLVEQTFALSAPA